jgi:hypothetical protein
MGFQVLWRPLLWHLGEVSENVVMEKGWTSNLAEDEVHQVFDKTPCFSKILWKTKGVAMAETGGFVGF